MRNKNLAVFPDFLHPDIRLRKIGFILLLCVVVLYYLIVQLFTVDIPFGDEFTCALGWLQQHQLTTKTWSKFLHLFRQANEHRIFTYSLAVLTDYSIFGILNFKRLGWEANLGMIPLLFLVNLLNTTDRRNPWLLLIVALWLFVPQHEITDWPIVGFGAIIQYAIVVASLWLLSRQDWVSLAGAVLLASLATFSFGNGMLTFPAGFLVIALKKPQKPLVWIIWVLAMVATIFLYFQDYHFRNQSGLLLSAIGQPLQIIQYFLTFFGTIIARFPGAQLWWITIAGIIPLATLACLVIVKWKEVRNHPVALALLLFIILSAAMAAVSRQPFGVFGATAPRYILLQALFLAVLSLLYINVFAQKYRWIPGILLCIGLLYFGGRLVRGVKQMNNHKAQLHELIIAYHQDPSRKVIFGPDPPLIKKILDQSIKSGIYFPPAIPDDEKYNDLFRNHHHPPISKCCSPSN